MLAAGAVSLYIVCAPACSSLSSSCLMVISNSGGTAAVKRTLTSAFIHMFECRHQKTLSTNFCCLRQNIKKNKRKVAADAVRWMKYEIFQSVS